MTCERCGVRLPAAGRGRIPRFCSGRCRVAAHRAARRLPTELTSRPRWVRHQAKRPLTVDGRPAGVTWPRTWSTYEQVKASTVGDGIGFVLGEGIACLDLDHCLVGGQLTDLAADVLARVPGAYVEVSPSGEGLHVWGLAPEGPARITAGLEAYSSGRYITVTGRVFRPGKLVDLAEFL